MTARHGSKGGAGPGDRYPVVMAIRIQEIPLSIPVDLLPKNILLQFDNAMCLVERDRSPGRVDGRIAVRFFHENESGPSEFLVPKTRVLKDFVMQEGKGIPIRAFSLPPGRRVNFREKRFLVLLGSGERRLRLLLGSCSGGSGLTGAGERVSRGEWSCWWGSSWCPPCSCFS